MARRKELSLIEEIHRAAEETAKWPAWMKDNRLWHNQLVGRNIVLSGPGSGRTHTVAALTAGAKVSKATGAVKTGKTRRKTVAPKASTSSTRRK